MVVKGEELQADEAAQGQAGRPVLLDLGIARLRAMLPGGDHGENGVARPVERGAGEGKSRAPFGAVPFGEREGDQHHVPSIRDHETPRRPRVSSTRRG